MTAHHVGKVDSAAKLLANHKAILNEYYFDKSCIYSLRGLEKIAFH